MTIVVYSVGQKAKEKVTKRKKRVSVRSNADISHIMQCRVPAISTEAEMLDYTSSRRSILNLILLQTKHITVT